MKKTLIIDCDPGVDDATGLLLAFAAPDLEVLAVTTVGGNVPAAQTARNACILRQIAGREDVPVFMGAEQPLRRAPAGAGEFHGAEGLGDLAPVETRQSHEAETASEALIRLIHSREPKTITLVVMGPMTNVALALRQDPSLADRIQQIIAMGGARSEGGNITASAEFNIWADPDAAHEVLSTSVPVVLLGLDATHQVRATEERIAAIETIDSDPARTVAAMLRFSQRVERTIVGWDAAPLHDPCTIAYLMRPELFEVCPAHIRIETESDLTRGHTAVEFRVAADSAPHLWATKADAEGVFDLITRTLSDGAIK